MDALAIIAKITGAALLIWTGRSIYKHVANIRTKGPAGKKNDDASQNNASIKDEKQHSITEHALNNLLLYLWFAFLIAFSLGLILNN